MVHSPTAHTHRDADGAVLALCECGALAVWEMAPSDSVGAWCDNCVPRGCSCNSSYDDETQDWTGPEATDDDGRLLPCCEVWFWPEGFAAQPDDTQPGTKRSGVNP